MTYRQRCSKVASNSILYSVIAPHLAASKITPQPKTGRIMFLLCRSNVKGQLLYFFMPVMSVMENTTVLHHPNKGGWSNFHRKYAFASDLGWGGTKYDSLCGRA